MSVPPSVGDVLGAAGACPEIAHQGKTWKIGYPTKAAKDRLEKLVVADAWASVQAAFIGDPQHDAELKESYHESVRNREYRTGGKLWAKAFSRMDGQILFYLSLVQEHQPAATSEDVITLMADCPDEFMTAMELVTPRFFFVAAEAMGLPKDKQPAWATAQAEAFLKAIRAARTQMTLTS